MTTRYRVEYALKSHRRDQFIEWLKGLLAVPFVLNSQPAGSAVAVKGSIDQMATSAKSRYASIMKDVEELIEDHTYHVRNQTLERSKLKLLVPSIGSFFSPLRLQDAFHYQDEQRRISSRRFVPPSFNDVRIMLNTAQVMGLSSLGPVELITFDGDVTLYDDGMNLSDNSPMVPRLLSLLRRGTRIGIVTAAGYTEPKLYHVRLEGILNAIHADNSLLPELKKNLIIVGGEANFLFRYSHNAPFKLEGPVPRDEWMLPEMKEWKDADIKVLLDIAEQSLRACVENMSLPATIVRKERCVGIVPKEGHKFTREQLEETVLSTQRDLDLSLPFRHLPFCAFNGGSDVFVDIGDKSLGVRCCQRILGKSTPSGEVDPVSPSRTLHVGDQFLSAGANDFKARLVSTTAWIASPAETKDSTIGLGSPKKQLVDSHDNSVIVHANVGPSKGPFSKEGNTQPTCASMHSKNGKRRHRGKRHAIQDPAATSPQRAPKEVLINYEEAKKRIYHHRGRKSRRPKWREHRREVQTSEGGQVLVVPSPSPFENSRQSSVDKGSPVGKRR